MTTKRRTNILTNALFTYHGPNKNIDESLRFYCEGLGLKEVRRKDVPAGKFTLIFLATPDDIDTHDSPYHRIDV